MQFMSTMSTATGWSPERLAWTVLAAVVIILIGWSLIEARAIQISRAMLSSPRLPPAFEDTRVVFMADIHAGPLMSRSRMSALVDRVCALEPDMVILGGDYVGGRGRGPAHFYSEIKRLRAPLGVFAVLGNHDYWEGVEQAKRGLVEAGITLLLNDSAEVCRDDACIRIAGVDDAWMGTADISAATRAIRFGEFAILVSHSPDYFAEALPTMRGIFDLALAGHTHGGQVTVFGLTAPLVPSKYGQRYRGGWLDEAGVPLLVTRGVGNVTLPVRFFNRPEINLIELKRGAPAVEA